MEMLQEEDPTKYEAHFSKYLEAGIDADKMEDMRLQLMHFKWNIRTKNASIRVWLAAVSLKGCSSQEMYTEAHEKIREDPTGEPAEKKDCEVAYSLQ